jgi:hypothetical protein
MEYERAECGVHILAVTATDGNGNADIGNASIVMIKRTADQLTG